MIKLSVYIADDCWSCEETHRIVADIATEHPEVDIALLNLSDSRTQRPDAVFATPTYMVNGRIAFLGNPTRDQLRQKIKTLSSA